MGQVLRKIGPRLFGENHHPSKACCGIQGELWPPDDGKSLKFNPQYCRKLISKYPKRIAAVLKAKGQQTKHWDRGWAQIKRGERIIINHVELLFFNRNLIKQTFRHRVPDHKIVWQKIQTKKITFHEMVDGVPSGPRLTNIWQRIVTKIIK